MRAVEFEPRVPPPRTPAWVAGRRAPPTTRAGEHIVTTITSEGMNAQRMNLDPEPVPGLLFNALGNASGDALEEPTSE